MNPKTPPNPDSLAANRHRISAEIRDALADGGVDIVPQAAVEALIGVVVAECTELRSRIVDRILGPLIGRYECGGVGGMTDAQLEMLATTIALHYEGPKGEIVLSPEAIATFQI